LCDQVDDIDNEEFVEPRCGAALQKISDSITWLSQSHSRFLNQF